MQERDYRIKTQATADENRRLAAERARFTVEKEAFATEREMQRQAMLDPEKLEQYNLHYEQMAKNPLYRKTFEDAQSGKMAAAELEIVREEQRDQVNREAADNLGNFIKETGTQYPGVDPDRVRQIYAKELRSGDIQEITEASVHQVYKQEAEYVKTTLSPLQAQLTALEAKIASLTDTKATTAHNAKTDKALVNAKAPPKLAATGNGTAVGTSTPETKFKPFTTSELPDKIREWSRRT